MALTPKEIQAKKAEALEARYVEVEKAFDDILYDKFEKIYQEITLDVAELKATIGPDFSDHFSRIKDTFKKKSWIIEQRPDSIIFVPNEQD